MGQGEGRGGQREEHKSQMVALCSQPLSIHTVPWWFWGASGVSVAAPVSEDVEGLQGCAGEQGGVLAIPSRVCGHHGRAGMSGVGLNGVSSNSFPGWNGGWFAACHTDPQGVCCSPGSDTWGVHWVPVRCRRWPAWGLAGKVGMAIWDPSSGRSV